MIALTRIRELDVSGPASAGRPAHLSAASGLVCVQSFLYVVADDELHLGVFRAGETAPGDLIRLFDGALPDPKPERKKQKPDFEALALLPPHGNYRHGALLALGSGSRANRRMGALVGLDATGAVQTSAAIDLSPLLAPLDSLFAELNIEGAVVTGGELLLFQRGNRTFPENAIIRFPLSPFLDSLGSGRADALAPSAVQPVDLGQINGVPFCVTDAALLPGGDIVFTAVAEDTGDAYEDGPCVAAAIGLAGSDGTLRWLRRLDRPHKIEGIDARANGDVIDLLLVTDADDPAIPAGRPLLGGDREISVAFTGLRQTHRAGSGLPPIAPLSQAEMRYVRE